MMGGACSMYGDRDLDQGRKIKYSLYSALIFFLIASPMMYMVTSRLFGSWIATRGCPTGFGVLLHSIVYFLAVWGFMNLPLDK
jgi:hypothetical protein